MLLNPPYDNGRDPVIFETALDRPLKEKAWRLWMADHQPRIAPTPEMIERAKMRPSITPRDLYGLKGHHLNTHTHMLPQGETE